jgi:hypothetical protein
MLAQDGEASHSYSGFGFCRATAHHFLFADSLPFYLGEKGGTDASPTFYSKIMNGLIDGRRFGTNSITNTNVQTGRPFVKYCFMV